VSGVAATKFPPSPTKARTVPARIARIEFGEQVAALHPVARIHEAARELAADAERQRTFFPRADLAGISTQRCRISATGPHHEHGPGCLLRSLVAAASGEGEHRCGKK